MGKQWATLCNASALLLLQLRNLLAATSATLLPESAIILWPYFTSKFWNLICTSVNIQWKTLHLFLSGRESMRHFSWAWRIIFHLPPHDTLLAPSHNIPVLHVNRTQTTGGGCKRKIPVLWNYTKMDVIVQFVCLHMQSSSFSLSQSQKNVGQSCREFLIGVGVSISPWQCTCIMYVCVFIKYRVYYRHCSYQLELVREVTIYGYWYDKWCCSCVCNWKHAYLNRILAIKLVL